MAGGWDFSQSLTIGLLLAGSLIGIVLLIESLQILFARQVLDWRREGWRARRGGDFDDGAYRQPPGYYYRSWQSGERLPISYRAPAYIIPDAAYYHLAPPPPGYYWVRVDHDAVLAAIATGIVLNVVGHEFH